MTTEFLAFAAGIVMIVAFAVGGGFKVKEIEIPSMAPVSRGLCLIVGIGLIGLSAASKDDYAALRAYLGLTPIKPETTVTPPSPLSDTMGSNTTKPPADFEKVPVVKPDDKVGKQSEGSDDDPNIQNETIQPPTEPKKLTWAEISALPLSKRPNCTYRNSTGYYLDKCRTITEGYCWYRSDGHRYLSTCPKKSQVAQ